MTTTTNASTTGASICTSARVLVGLGQALAKGIDPDRASRKPEGVDTNHPVFIFGHLALYADLTLEVLGLGDRRDPEVESWGSLFEMGVECRDDCPEHPTLDVALRKYTERMGAVIEALAAADESVFTRPNPREQMREMCPTVGDMANFVLVMHASYHLGQLSAWRRCMGMAPVRLGG